MNHRRILLLLVLVSVALVVSGCGVPREGVTDWATAEPSGWWQVVIVWPLAKSLIWLNTLLADFNIPYSWGFAIILFTVIIKLITFPLTMTQIKGMQAQKDLQPKIQELQQKYGKNRDKLAQEQMKLYKEAGVNPLSGCLPMVVQMPVLFGLYSALVALGPVLIDSRFFWIPDLGFPEFTQGLSWLPDTFNAGEYYKLVAYLILPALLMVSQVYMQRMTTATTPTANDKQAAMMKQMTTMMTLMFGFFTLQVPAGLTLYWVTSNLLQMGQTFVANSIAATHSAPSMAGHAATIPATATATPVDGSAASSATDSTDARPKKPTPRRRTRRNRKRR